MGKRDNAEWRRSGRQGDQSRYEGRRELIVRAARTCYAHKGVSKTSIADIARELNITRELFYYYFDSKDVVTDAVVESYVLDFQALLADELKQTDGLADEEQLARGLAVARAWLATGADDSISMLAILQETGTTSSTLYLAACALVRALEVAGVARDDSSGDTQVDGLALGLCGALCAMLSDATIGDRALATTLAPLLSSV